VTERAITPINLLDLIDPQKCYALIRFIRWGETVTCPINSIEGFWSLLRSWLRPHRGISQDKLPLYLGFFEFVHNVRARGKRLLRSLLECLLT